MAAEQSQNRVGPQQTDAVIDAQEDQPVAHVAADQTDIAESKAQMQKALKALSPLLVTATKADKLAERGDLTKAEEAIGAYQAALVIIKQILASSWMQQKDAKTQSRMEEKRVKVETRLAALVPTESLGVQVSSPSTTGAISPVTDAAPNQAERGSLHRDRSSPESAVQDSPAPEPALSVSKQVALQSKRPPSFPDPKTDSELYAKLELVTKQLATLQKVADENMATAKTEHAKEINALQAQLQQYAGRESRVHDLEDEVAALQEQVQSADGAKDFEMQVHRLQSDLDAERSACAVFKADLAAEQASHAQCRAQLARETDAHAACRANLAAEQTVHEETRGELASKVDEFAVYQTQATVDLESSQAALRRTQEALETEETARSARIDQQQNTGSIIEGELADARSRIAGLQAQLLRMEEEATSAGQEIADWTTKFNAAQATVRQLTEDLAVATDKAVQSAELLDVEKQRMAGALQQAEEAVVTTAAAESTRRDGDQSAIRALQVEVDRLRAASAESEAVASAKIQRLQQRCDAQVDKHSASISKLKQRLKAEETSRAALEDKMAQARSRFEADRQSTDAEWSSRIAEIQSKFEDQLARSEAAQDAAKQRMRDSFEAELKVRDEQLTAFRQSSDDQSQLLELANQRADESAAATIESERSAARAATLAQSKLQELEDEVWRMRQAGAAVSSPSQDHATQAELVSLRQKLAQAEAALRQVVDATPEQQADAIGQQLVMAMGLHRDIVTPQDSLPMDALQSVRKELAEARTAAATQAIAHEEEQSQLQMRIAELTRVARHDANAKLQAEQEADGVRRELSRREDELEQLAATQAYAGIIEDQSIDPELEKALVQLANCRTEAAEAESAFVERLKVAEQEAAEATKALEQSGNREAQLATTLSGVEQMLVIKDEEVDELQAAHAAELAQQQAQALSLRRHDQDVRRKLEEQLRTLTSDAVSTQHKAAEAADLAAEEHRQLRAQLTTTQDRAGRAEEMLSEVEADKTRLEREAADSATRLKSVVDQRKDLSDRVVELERKAAVARERTEAHERTLAKELEKSRAVAESARQENDMLMAEIEAEKQLFEWEREWRKHEAEAEIAAAEAEISAQTQAATRRCAAAEGRLDSLAAAKSAATSDAMVLRTQMADVEEAKRVAELERDAALKASRQRAAENEAGLVTLQQELALCQAELSRAQADTRTADRRADEARAVAAKTEEALALLEWELSRNTQKHRDAEDQLSLARREIQMLSTGTTGLRSHVSTNLSVVDDEVDVDEAVPPNSGRGNASPRGILAQKIRELAELADEDLITEAEFTQGKDELLASLQPY